MSSAYRKLHPLAGIVLGCLLAACGKTEPPASRIPLPAPPPRPATAQNIQAVAGFSLPSEIGGSAGGRQLYAVELKKGQLADLVVDQQGVDVKVSLYAPDRRRLATVDSVYGDQGPEILPVIAEAGETYRLEVQSADSGRYELKIAALRPATPRDQDRVAAERLWSAGEELRARADRVSIEAAVAREAQALALFRSLDEKDREARVLHGLGEAHLSLERNAEAVRFLQQSLALFRQLGREREASRVLNDLGKAHRSLGEPAQALERYREALALNRRLGDRPAQAVMLTNLGKVYDDLLGETDTALDHYEQALDLWHELGNRRDRSQEAVTLKSLGALYQFRGETRKALDYLEPALAILEAEGPTLQTANLLTTIGDTCSRSGQYRKAVERYRRALGIQRRIGDLGGEGVTLNSIGCTYVLMKRPREAREWFARAATVFRKTGNRQGQAAALTGLASIDTEASGGRVEALATLDQVLPLLAASGDRDTEAAARLALARARRQLGDLPAALQAIEAGIASIESLRVSSARQEIRTSFLASKQPFYASTRPSDGARRRIPRRRRSPRAKRPGRAACSTSWPKPAPTCAAGSIPGSWTARPRRPGGSTRPRRTGGSWRRPGPPPSGSPRPSGTCARSSPATTGCSPRSGRPAPATRRSPRPAPERPSRSSARSWTATPCSSNTPSARNGAGCGP